MESLEIQNFLTIREAKLDVRPFTLIIGPQASGKSIIAKALHVFRQILARELVASIGELEDFGQFLSRVIIRFEQIFPQYTWLDQRFSLTYSNNDLVVALSSSAPSSTVVDVTYSAKLVELYQRAQRTYRNRVFEARQPGATPIFDNYRIHPEVLSELLHDQSNGHYFRTSVFVPANRSFFAHLQKKVFFFLSNNIAIDPLLKEFGAVYEDCRHIFDLEGLYDDDPDFQLLMALRREMEHVVAGQYTFEALEDWIVSDRGKINLAHASSGQQEAVPLLVVLLNWNSLGWDRDRSPSFFIEEPEAHLFPTSQKRMVDIFAKLFSSKSYNFFLTTHSPYILTALNNLILASNVIEERGPEVAPQIQEIIGGERMIRFEDVSAYTIRESRLESILDEENRLIGASVIDSVSDEFERVFDRLLEIETV